MAEYLHENTPRDAVVLSMSWMRDGCSREDYRDVPPDLEAGPNDLVANGFLRTRSGRANIAPMVYSNIMSYEHHVLCHQRWNTLDRLGRAWMRRNADAVLRLLAEKEIGRSPDYIVVPASEGDWVRNSRLPFGLQAAVGNS